MNQHRFALFMLLIVTTFWGFTFPLIDEAARFVDPFSFVALRCWLAVIVLFPFVWRKLGGVHLKLILQGISLGFLNGASFVAQTIGLKTIDPASSAFITGLSTILVPFLLPFFKLGVPKYFNIACSLLSLLGLYLLTGTSLSQINIGFYWTILNAVFYALFIVYLQKVNPTREQVLTLALFQVLGCALLASFFLLFFKPHVIINHISLISIIFCGVVATAVVIVLQTRFQPMLPATEVVLIYCLEPVFASIFSYFIVDEKLSWHLLLGGSLILVSILLTEFQERLLRLKS